MVGHGGSSAGSYLADPTSPIPSHCASIVVTSTLRVNTIEKQIFYCSIDHIRYQNRNTVQYITILTLTVLVITIDALWEGIGDVGSGEVRAGTTSPMPDHKGFKLQ